MNTVVITNCMTDVSVSVRVGRPLMCRLMHPLFCTCLHGGADRLPGLVAMARLYQKAESQLVSFLRKSPDDLTL
jgi:hypothetical protein